MPRKLFKPEKTYYIFSLTRKRTCCSSVDELQKVCGEKIFLTALPPSSSEGEAASATLTSSSSSTYIVHDSPGREAQSDPCLLRKKRGGKDEGGRLEPIAKGEEGKGGGGEKGLTDFLPEKEEEEGEAVYFFDCESRPSSPPFHTQADKKPSSSSLFPTRERQQLEREWVAAAAKEKGEWLRRKKKKADLNPLLFRPPPTLILPPPVSLWPGERREEEPKPDLFFAGKGKKDCNHDPKAGATLRAEKKSHASSPPPSNQEREKYTHCCGVAFPWILVSPPPATKSAENLTD